MDITEAWLRGLQVGSQIGQNWVQNKQRAMQLADERERTRLQALQIMGQIDASRRMHEIQKSQVESREAIAAMNNLRYRQLAEANLYSRESIAAMNDLRYRQLAEDKLQQQKKYNEDKIKNTLEIAKMRLEAVAPKWTESQKALANAALTKFREAVKTYTIDDPEYESKLAEAEAEYNRKIQTIDNPQAQGGNVVGRFTADGKYVPAK